MESFEECKKRKLKEHTKRLERFASEHIRFRRMCIRHIKKIVGRKNFDINKLEIDTTGWEHPIYYTIESDGHSVMLRMVPNTTFWGFPKVICKMYKVDNNYAEDQVVAWEVNNKADLGNVVRYYVFGQ